MQIPTKDLKDYRAGDITVVKILDATEELMQHISFDHLKVTDICEKAGISRQTFYAHFKDKYEIAQWFWNLTAAPYLRQTGKSLSWYESNLESIRVFVAYPAFVSGLLRSEDYNSYLNHGYRSRVAFLKAAVTDDLGLELTEDLAFQIEFFVDAESRAIASWALNGMPVTPERLSALIEKCVPRELHDLLATPREEAAD